MLVGLGAVAFITLLERKYLGLRQIRLGPNKVSFNGTLQPVADGVKLLTKQFIKSGLRQRFLFLVSPTLLLRLFLVT
jgi:NADH-quinone oxidoreductase subunit H